MWLFKRFLSPAGREKYSDIRKYITERIPRLFDQIVGRDLRYFPQVRCKKEHIGSRFDGKKICPEEVNPNSIIYSFGIGRDISFDLTMIQRFDVDIFAFDPTPVSKNWLKKQTLPEKFHFFDYGVADYDGLADFYPFWPDDPTAHDFSIINPSKARKETVKCPVYRVETILNKLQHRKIDILKMDIEGIEYAVIEDILASNVKVSQLLVEFHHRYENVGLTATNHAIKLLNQNGFKIFSIGSDGQEYSFIRI